MPKIQKNFLKPFDLLGASVILKNTGYIRLLLLSIVTCFLISIDAFGQVGFRKGYVVLQNGDTVAGYLRETKDPYTGCSFKAKWRNDVTRYTPGEIWSYGFAGGKEYRSVRIQDWNKSNPEIFAELVLEGYVSVLDAGEVFCVQKRGENPIALWNTKSIQFTNGAKKTKYLEEYKSTLLALFGDCENVANQVTQAGYSRGWLTKIVTLYNQCMNQPTIISRNAYAKTKSRITFSSEVGFTRVNFITGDFTLTLKGPTKFVSSVNYRINYDLVFPRISERLFLSLGAQYGSFSISHKLTAERGSTTHNHSIDIDVDQLRFPVGLIYSLPGRKWSSFIECGMTNVFSLKQDTNWILLVVDHETNTNFSRQEPEFERKVRAGVWFGTGLETSLGRRANFLTGLRIETTRGLYQYRNNASVKGKFQDYHLVFGLRFK